METDLLKTLLTEISSISHSEIPGFARLIKKAPIAEKHDELYKAWELICQKLHITSKDLYTDVLAAIKSKKLCLLSTLSQQAQKKMYNPLRELGISDNLVNILNELGYYTLCDILNDTEKWKDGNNTKNTICEFLGEKFSEELNETFERLEIKKLQKV